MLARAFKNFVGEGDVAQEQLRRLLAANRLLLELELRAVLAASRTGANVIKLFLPVNYGCL